MSLTERVTEWRWLMQTMVTRLSDPYGECEDPSYVDMTHNAYAEYHPVVYTAHVSICISVCCHAYA